ncbi:hypothetical protein K457DRAFT_713320 [Linnemannia elongata AG-77]|uniref:Uncharacterized protein n=1 Tax=Linnemannia elongata AG-77 TaxID=1314771 RepID=A0A197KBC9_9FUNG|nr:hypothetical protein K457DRAFT_713320 [Linnemannia elongata AG-77]
MTACRAPSSWALNLGLNFHLFKHLLLSKGFAIDQAASCLLFLSPLFFLQACVIGLLQRLLDQSLALDLALGCITF